jgi:tRNA-2-methylthio-N6-dimethylallyladenosine synthase
VGKTLEVLVEGRGNAPARVRDVPLEGRTRDNYIVHFSGEDRLLGTLVKVRVTASRRIHLEGELVP